MNMPYTIKLRKICLMPALNAAAVMLTALIIFMGAVSYTFAAGDFKVENYDVHMVVNEDDTYRITETIDVHFTAPSHGIYWSIPLTTRLDRDGKVSRYYASVKDFKMLSGQKYEESGDSGTFSVKIGDAGKYADTDTEYSFTYLYDTRGDHLDDGDEVFHNLIGTDWEARSIDHVTFKVDFPKDIDASKVGIKTGYDQNVPFEAPDARTITGETDLDTLRGLTIRAVLPEGYFTRQAKNSAMVFYIIIGIIAAIACIGVFLWRKFGCDPKYPETIEFYPPEGLSAPEIAYLSKGYTSNSDIVSVLLTLADKGYLSISEIETESGKLKRKKTVYEIEQVREYDEDVIGEQAFMEALFKGGDRPVVKVEDLKNSFYKTIDEIEKSISQKYQDMLYDKTAGRYAGIMYIAGLLSLTALFAVSRITGGAGLFSGGIVDAVLPLLLTAAGFYAVGEAVRGGKGVKSFIIAITMSVVGLFTAWGGDTFIDWQTMPFLTGVAMCLLLFVVGGLCEKKTEYYAEIQARIKGYKRFLETAEKDSMETLAEQDPGYYYRNLAYAFALGVTSVYASRFSPLAQRPPEWYHSSHYIHDSSGPVHMANSINTMMSSVSTTMSSSPSGSGGGSFSGGGGGGGGSGGSW